MLQSFILFVYVPWNGSDAATASGTYYGWNALADQKQFVLFTDSRNDLEPKDIVDPNTGSLYDNYDVSNPD